LCFEDTIGSITFHRNEISKSLTNIHNSYNQIFADLLNNIVKLNKNKQEKMEQEKKDLNNIYTELELQKADQIIKIRKLESIILAKNSEIKIIKELDAN
jgi:hypothetical protein